MEKFTTKEKEVVKKARALFDHEDKMLRPLVHHTYVMDEKRRLCHVTFVSSQKGEIGVAICSNTDVWKRKFGVDLALLRAFDTDKVKGVLLTMPKKMRIKEFMNLAERFSDLGTPMLKKLFSL